MQVTGRTRPWILFLTTRAVRDQIDTETKQKLFDCVINNINDNDGFASALEESLGLNCEKIQEELSGTNQLTHAELVSLFGLAIGKWLLKMMMEANPKPLVRLLKSYCYRVEVDEPDMLSLAFIFKPLVSPPIDKTGLTPKVSKQDAHPGEQQLAVELLSDYCKIVDVDCFLNENEPTYDTMFEKSAKLLGSVHYDVDKYKKWVEQRRWRPK